MNFGKHADVSTVGVRAVSLGVGVGEAFGEDPPPDQRLSRRWFVPNGVGLAIDALYFFLCAVLVEAVLWRGVRSEVLDDSFLIEAVGVAECRGVAEQLPVRGRREFVGPFPGSEDGVIVDRTGVIVGNLPFVGVGAVVGDRLAHGRPDSVRRRRGIRPAAVWVGRGSGGVVRPGAELPAEPVDHFLAVDDVPAGPLDVFAGHRDDPAGGVDLDGGEVVAPRNKRFIVDVPNELPRAVGDVSVDPLVQSFAGLRDRDVAARFSNRVESDGVNLPRLGVAHVVPVDNRDAVGILAFAVDGKDHAGLDGV